MERQKTIQHDVEELAASLQRLDALPFLLSVLRKSNLISRSGSLLLGLLGAFFLVFGMVSAVLALVVHGIFASSWAETTTEPVPLKLGFFAIPAVGAFFLGIALSRVSIGLGQILKLCHKIDKDPDHLLKGFFSKRRKIPKSFPTHVPKILLLFIIFPLTIAFYILAILGTFAVMASISPGGNEDTPRGPWGEDFSRSSGFFSAYGLMIILVIVIWGFSFSLHRGILRILCVPSKTLLDSDKRTPVILFRSFADDTVKLVHPFFKVASLTHRFEEVIAMAAWRFGPVTGLGKPGELLPKLGAAREYYSEDNWKPAVQWKISESGTILVIANDSAGLAWEIGEIHRMKALSKVVFIFTPAGSKYKAMRSRNIEFISDLCGTPQNQIRSSAKHYIAAHIENEDTIHLYVSSRCFRWDYEAALYLINEGQLNRVLPPPLPMAPPALPAGKAK